MCHNLFNESFFKNVILFIYLFKKPGWLVCSHPLVHSWNTHKHQARIAEPESWGHLGVPVVPKVCIVRLRHPDADTQTSTSILGAGLNAHFLPNDFNVQSTPVLSRVSLSTSTCYIHLITNKLPRIICKCCTALGTTVCSKDLENVIMILRRIIPQCRKQEKDTGKMPSKRLTWCYWGWSGDAVGRR